MEISNTTSNSEVSVVESLKSLSVDGLSTAGVRVSSTVQIQTTIGEKSVGDAESRRIAFVYPDDTAKIPMIDPDTDEPNGTEYTIGELRAMIYSLHKAVEANVIEDLTKDESE